MLVLRSAPASPYGRKVKMAASLLGLTDRIDVKVADTQDPNEALRAQNPLGKIPTLVLEDGSTLFDSRVIVEYLDILAGGGKIIPRGKTRFEALRLQALADGICDAALLIVYEGRYRTPEQKVQSWVDLQQGKIDRALAALNAKPPRLTKKITIGQIALAAALGYLDLRHEGKWRKKNKKLVRWLDKYAAAVPSFEATRFKG
jgi:glutathione S-transferase